MVEIEKYSNAKYIMRFETDNYLSAGIKNQDYFEKNNHDWASNYELKDIQKGKIVTFAIGHYSCENYTLQEAKEFAQLLLKMIEEYELNQK